MIDTGDLAGDVVADQATPELAGALEELSEAIDRLARVDLDVVPEEVLARAALAIPSLGVRLDHAMVTTVEAVDRRGVARSDGALSAEGWLRTRTRLGHRQCRRLSLAAQRLHGLPRLDWALRSGPVSLSQALLITDAAVPNRVEAIAAAEAPLVELAMATGPREVANALARIRELADPCGGDPADEDEQEGAAAGPTAEDLGGPTPRPGAGPDARRGVTLSPTIDGLWDLRGTLDVLTGERLAALLEAFPEHDPAGAPLKERRSPAQRRHDALTKLLERLLAVPDLPTVQGQRPHVLAVVDLATLLGVDDAAPSCRTGQRAARARDRPLGADHGHDDDGTVPARGTGAHAAHPARVAAHRDGGDPSDVSQAGLRPARELDRRPSPAGLARGWAHRPRQRHPAVPPAPRVGDQGRLGRQRRPRHGGVHVEGPDGRTRRTHPPPP